MAYQYKHVALGGTFDLLHKGHISLLEKAFEIAKLVSIGITTDKFCKDSGKIPYQSQEIRRKHLTEYLKKHHLLKRTKIVHLDNIYGTTLKDKTILAIVVSKETFRGAQLINNERVAKNLKKLTIIAVPMERGRDGKIVSSDRIRNGEISTSGQNYKKLLLKISGKRFDKKIRRKLKKPFGVLTQDSSLKNTQPPIITVGDITTVKFLNAKIMPKLAIVDFFVNRQRVYQNLHDLGFDQANPDYLVQNTPGQISRQLIKAIKDSLGDHTTKQVILVEGEEDLAFIPALLLAPIPSTVFYGQPKIGLVKVETSIDAKERLCTLLNLAC